MKITLLIILLLVLASGASAQDNVEACVKNHNAPPANSYYWPPDTNVKVYFTRAMFTDEQRATLLAAMQSWTNAALESGAGVKFSYEGEADGLVSCAGCLT